MDSLTPGQRHFVAEYVASRNATQSYMRAFPEATYTTARTMSSKLLANANISEEVNAAARSHARACRVSARRVLKELALIAFSDPEDTFTEDASSGLPVPRKWNTVPPSARRAIKSVRIKKRILRSNEHYFEEVEEVEFKFHDKMKALGQLFNHLGLGRESDALAQLLGLLEANSGCGPPAQEQPSG